jgi:hypothetical protein
MNTISLKLCLFASFFAGLAGSDAAKSALPGNTATEAINRVFERYPEGKKEIWPISGYPSYTRIRPVQQSTFAPLRKYFSSRQQQNVDRLLKALSDLIDARNRLAKKLDIHQKWWPTGIDLLKVDAVLTSDLLTGRTDNPDKMIISRPRALDGKLEFTIQEVFTEHGQDRALGQGHRTSIVTLIPKKDRWVIDEIATSTTDAYGDTRVETLTQRLQDAIEPLRAAESAIAKLPQTLEIRKGVRAKN